MMEPTASTRNTAEVHSRTPTFRMVADAAPLSEDAYSTRRAAAGFVTSVTQLRSCKSVTAFVGMAPQTDKACDGCRKHGNASEASSFKEGIEHYLPYFRGPKPSPVSVGHLRKCILHLTPSQLKATLLQLVVHCSDDKFHAYMPMLEQLMQMDAFRPLDAGDGAMPLLELAIRGADGYVDEGNGRGHGRRPELCRRTATAEVDKETDRRDSCRCGPCLSSEFKRAAAKGVPDRNPSQSLVVAYLADRIDTWSSQAEQLQCCHVMEAVEMLDWKSVNVLLKRGFSDEKAADALDCLILIEMAGTLPSLFAEYGRISLPQRNGSAQLFASILQ